MRDRERSALLETVERLGDALASVSAVALRQAEKPPPSHVDVELAELRDLMVEMDHRIAGVRAELHTHTATEGEPRP